MAAVGGRQGEDGVLLGSCGAIWGQNSGLGTTLLKVFGGEGALFRKKTILLWLKIELATND